MTGYFLGRGRTGVVIMADGTYQLTEKSSDPDLNKSLFYAPYGKHIIKLMLFVSSQPKVSHMFVLFLSFLHLYPLAL